MPLFVCDKCHAIDNSALGGSYWTRFLDGKEERLCCECETGHWHEQFPKRIFDILTDNTAEFDYIPLSIVNPGKAKIVEDIIQAAIAKRERKRLAKLAHSQR